MKEKLNLRNAILWTVALMALSLFFASFGASATLKGTVEGDYISMTCSNAIWGSGSIIGYSDGSPIGEFLAKKVVNIPGLIGAIVLFLSAGFIILDTFVVKNEKAAKIVAFVCAGAILAAGVLFFFVSQTPWYVLQEWMREEGMAIDIKTLKQAYAGLKASSAFGIGGGIFAILLAGGVVVSQLIKNVQFIKSK